jgi:LmbE family N-acetylglucosaminyl deacetylase
MEWKKKITKIIREFAPHLVFTHRTCDYHADHRAVAQLVMDVAYFLKVPYWCPEYPVPDIMPAVFFMRDRFSMPRELYLSAVNSDRNPPAFLRITGVTLSRMLAPAAVRASIAASSEDKCRRLPALIKASMD